MTTVYTTQKTREEQLDAEIAAAEAELNGTTQEEPQTQDVVTDDGTRSTPESAPQENGTDWEKRYKDLQSHADKEKARLKALLDEAGIQSEEKDRVAELEAQLAELQSREAERETIDVVSQAQEAVHSVHPDFVGVISSPEFTDWIQQQPEVYQNAIYADRPDANLAIDAITLFKVQHGVNNQAVRQQQMQDQAAMSVSGGHRSIPEPTKEKVWTWNEINKMHPSEYAKHEAEIDAAFQKGLIR